MTASSQPHILVIDDDPAMRKLIADYLGENEIRVSAVATGAEMQQVLAEHAIDLVVLDLRLGAEDGMQLAQKLREESAIPIVLVTGKREEADRVMGLELGADDYIVKPFSPREVVARVKAVLRRTGGQRPDELDQTIQAGDITIVPRERVVTIAQRDIPLTAKEFDLLYFLASHPRQVFTRDQLLDRVWGTEYIADESTVTVHVRRLREKIEDDPSSPQRVVTVWGVGYKFNG
jgi:DNA-binding response OmpR family regulator